jgi:hypothetical protein
MTLFNGTALNTTGPDTLISCNYINASFEEFCGDIRSKTGVVIYHRTDWTRQLVVSFKADNVSVLDAVRTVLSGTEFQVSVWNGNLVLLKKTQLISGLPEFEKSVVYEAIQQTAEGMTEAEERYLKGRQTGALETIQVGDSENARHTKAGDKVKILGRIIEEETGEPVIGAIMYVEETATGTISDQDGFLSMVLKPGKYTARFEFIGYEKINCILEVLSAASFTVEMKKVVIPIEEVIIFGDRQVNVVSRDPGLEKISSKTIKEIPTLLGERDILKASEMLPGIVSIGEGSSGLNVRGGSSDQNAFYINKIPVFNTSHLFGFFPAFNADIIKDFSIYKGHVPAQYGGRLSSVFNIITRQGNRKRLMMHGSVNPVTAALTLEGPILKEKSSVLLSGRSSYSDWILKRINDPLIRTSTASFNDLALSLNYDFKKMQVSLFGFKSYDDFQLSDITRYRYANTGASLNLRYNFSATIQGDLTFIGARYDFETVDQQEMSVAYKHNYQIDHYETRIDLNHILFNTNSLEYGASFILSKLDRGRVLPYSTESIRNPVDLGREQGMETSLYISDMYDVLSWLNANVGLRYTLYAPLGPKTVYTYIPGSPKDPRYLEDSILFTNNEPIRWYSSPEIRATINVKTDAEGSVKLAFNQMHQNIFMLNNTITVAPNTQWKLADYYLAPARSNQVSLGVFRNFSKAGWETSLECFYKHANKYPDFKDGVDFLDGTATESQILQGAQKSYGIEFFAKKSGRKISGWLSYTYSRSIVRINGGEAWNSINGGKGYPANYDIPHALNTMINYRFNRRLNISSVFAYQTGRPITYPLSVYYINDIPYTDYSSRNKFNIPDYFRMDLSATIEGSLRKNKLLHSSLVISVYNVTGRHNPYSVYFRTEEGKINSYKYSVIGVPFFTVTWLFKLGNYATE